MAALIAARCLIGVVFAAAVAGKLGRWAAFVESVRVLLPAGGAVSGLAVGVVVTEAAVVALAALPATAASGVVLGAGLLLTFAVAILAADRRGRRTECRCFGGAGGALDRRHAVRNLILAAVALAAGFAGGPAGPGLAVLGAALGVVGGVGFVLADDLADLFGKTTRVPGPSRTH